MGQKVNPIGFRVGINKDWRSKWFAEKDKFGDYLAEDIRIRKYIKKNQYSAGISKILIEKSAARMRIIIYTSRPGIIIGRRGESIDRLKEEVSKLTDKEIHIDIEEVKVPELDAQLVAENVALQLERRVSYRRAMKRAISQAQRMGCKGIKMIIKGRLGGAEIARSEKYKYGKIPLQTIRADIEYGFTIARTTYGAIGVKVWIYKGEILPEKEKQDEGKIGQQEDTKQQKEKKEKKKDSIGITETEKQTEGISDKLEKDASSKQEDMSKEDK